MSQSPFDLNPELTAMREDVANRVFNLKVVESVINIATIALIGAGIFMLAASGAGAGLGNAIVPLAAGAATGLGSIITMKARKRLEIDQEYLQTKMQGGNWWGGYRREVMEHGHSPAINAPMMQGLPQKPQEHSR